MNATFTYKRNADQNAFDIRKIKNLMQHSSVRASRETLKKKFLRRH